jgi:transcription initiation factor TFIIIB Brf1 subunit/transcription initiation factor TFIIB
MPRKAHQPTPKTRTEVMALTSFGVPQEEIAKFIGVDSKTLRKHYREEMDTAETSANATVARFLYNVASGKALKDGASYSDCVRAAMFWAKTRMRWRETNHIDHSSSDGTMQPLVIVTQSDK